MTIFFKRIARFRKMNMVSFLVGESLAENEGSGE